METPIREHLWNLMLSTNDCYPGCACDDDFFEITDERISEWILSAPNQHAFDAFENIKSIRDGTSETKQAAAAQLSRYFDSEINLNDWIAEWSTCIRRNLPDKPNKTSHPSPDRPELK